MLIQAVLSVDCEHNTLAEDHRSERNVDRHSVEGSDRFKCVSIYHADVS